MKKTRSKLSGKHDDYFSSSGTVKPLRTRQTGYLKFKFSKNVPEKFKLELRKVNKLFTRCLVDKRHEFVVYTPYLIRFDVLVSKNRWTHGTYVAINQNDGTLDLHLNFEKLYRMPKFPVEALTWVIFHEFRHKIQLNDEHIQSVINYPNWQNFNQFMQKKFRKDEDMINHIFHELNPAEVDANIFACEMMSGKFNGNAFNINDESLKLLTIK